MTSWGWTRHIVGGESQRLSTLTTSDRSTLMAVRAAILEAPDSNEGAAELIEICGSHIECSWVIGHYKRSGPGNHIEGDDGDLYKMC